MAAAQRSSLWKVKIHRDLDFVYDAESANFMLRRRRGEELQNSPSTDSPAIATSAGKDFSESVYWSDIDLPLINDNVGNNNIHLLSREYVQYQRLSFYQGAEFHERE